MMVRYLGPGLLGLGITALIAGFMSGMAGNVSAFSTVWTYDIYKPLINKKGSDSHYVLVGRLSILIGVAVSIGAAYLVHARARHHGLRAGAVQHLYRAAAGRHSLRHVLEARQQAGRLSRPADRHRLFGQPVHVGQAQSCRAGQRGAFARRQADGRKCLPRAVGILLCRHLVIVVSLFTKPRPVAELDGLVYGATKLPKEEPVPFYKREWMWAVRRGRHLRRAQHPVLVAGEVSP